MPPSPPYHHQAPAPDRPPATPPATLEKVDVYPNSATASTSWPTLITVGKRNTYSKYASSPSMPMSTIAALQASPNTNAVVPMQADWPDWPPLMLNYLIASLLMLWLVTAVLFLSQVPKMVEMRWLLDRTRQRRESWKREEEEAGHHRLRDSQVPLVRMNDRRRSTDSGAELATGLGISMPGTQTAIPRLRRRRSFGDEDRSDERRPSSGGQAESIPLTAPLLSSRSFLSMSVASASSGSDLESGLHTPTTDPLPIASTEHLLPSEPGRRGLAGFLESVNVALEYIAARLARATCEHVDRPEEGLLLPVMDVEREREGEFGW